MKQNFGNMNKINVAELLKDCPKGMELDCLLCNSHIVLEGVVGDESTYPIRAVAKDGFHHVFTKYGTSYDHDDAKCVIFPKGKTTWEGFHRPFKDGDIVYIRDEYSDATFTYVAILKQIEKEGQIHSHCFYNYEDDIFDTHEYLCDGYNIRFATEEEKQKLFKAIKDNGYKWNSETKTLEKLIKPKFKVGDKIFNVLRKSMGALGTFQGTISEITDDKYIFTDGSYIYIRSQDNYELVPNKSDKFDITTLVPFESKVLVRSVDGDLWKPAIYGFPHSKGCYVVGGVYWGQCIPYEENKELLGTTNNPEEYGSR